MLLYPDCLLTKKAHDFIKRRFVRKLTDNDWDSIFLYWHAEERLSLIEMERTIIVEKIMINQRQAWRSIFLSKQKCTEKADI